MRTVCLTGRLGGADYPLAGWLYDGKLIHPPEAYTELESWLSHFEATFPDKAKKMHDYSERNGWTQYAHECYWPRVCLSWLQKNAIPNVK